MKRNFSVILIVLCWLTAPAYSSKDKLLDEDFMRTAGPREVEQALAQGALVNISKNTENRTPLYMAAEWSRQPGVIDKLLSAGADVHAVDNKGRTPLHAAAIYSKYPAIVKALLKGKANPNAVDLDGNTPLHNAVAFNESPEMIMVLIDGGASLFALTKANKTPFFVALIHFNLTSARVLYSVEGNILFSQNDVNQIMESIRQKDSQVDSYMRSEVTRMLNNAQIRNTCNSVLFSAGV